MIGAPPDTSATTRWSAHRSSSPPTLRGRAFRRNRKGPSRRLQHHVAIMDDGRLTDGQGRHVDFRNTVIIMTSNIGSSYLVAENVGTERTSRRPLDKLPTPERTFQARVPQSGGRHHRLPSTRQATAGEDHRVAPGRDCAACLADRKISIELTDAARSCSSARATTRIMALAPLKRSNPETRTGSPGPEDFRWRGTARDH